MMEDALLFPYRIIRKALLFTIVTQVRSLLDPAQTPRRKEVLDNLSFDRLVKTLEPDFFAPHEKLMEMLKEIKQHCEPICTWANKRICHADLLTVCGQEKLPDVDKEHFQKALDMMLKLLHVIHVYFHGPHALMALPDRDGDADKLIDCIRIARKTKQDELARMGFL